MRVIWGSTENCIGVIVRRVEACVRVAGRRVDGCGKTLSIGIALGLSTLSGVVQASELSMYARYLDDVSQGPPETWPQAVRILASDDEALQVALDALLSRMTEFGVSEKRLLAKKLRPFVDREDVALTLATLVEGEDREAAERAAETLRRCVSKFCAPIALRLLAPGNPNRRATLGHVLDLYAREHPELELYEGSPRQWYAQQLSEDVRDDRFATPLFAYLQDSDPAFRLALVRALRGVIDGRVTGVFARLAGDSDPKIRSSVLWGLGKRGDRRVYERLIALAPQRNPESGSRYQRNQYFSDLGYAYWWDLDNLVLRYREVSTPEERKDHERILRAASAQLRAGLPGPDARIEELAGDEDPLLAEIMGELLVQRRRAVVLAAAEGTPSPSVSQWVWVAMTLASAALGVVLFSWSFRLLKLKYLLARLPLSKIRSASQGLVALRGRVVPADGALVEYPSTAERCAYYPGIERREPGFGFYIEDETGRIRVEAAGAVLLSEKRLLFPDDDVHVIGTVMTRQHTKPDGEVVEERVVVKPSVRRSAYERLMHGIIDGVLGANARGGHSRALFSDARTCFWIWDDPREKPLCGAWDFAVVFGVVALLGAWLAVFAVGGLAMLDREYAQMLADFGRVARPPRWMGRECRASTPDRADRARTITFEWPVLGVDTPNGPESAPRSRPPRGRGSPPSRRVLVASMAAGDHSPQEIPLQGRHGTACRRGGLSAWPSHSMPWSSPCSLWLRSPHTP